ncbi:hypothetical protein RN001_014667 [Aquatica leii]|uniref:Mismatch repair endonuclease PMS2 n=1 Tax=Aquatica leii TaxID=1421715 RepID=A0AAN7SKP0_9COLE|nr:hypothetical protein RN001_014667 [Aquatica leii]
MADTDDCVAETNTNPEREFENPDVIKPINSNTVHRICSGQVVLSLAIAVKELIENAIDANATNIEVRLKEYGSDLIEVNDNGTGVRQENFQALTLKHYTSKLKQFTDLESIGTLGFRGEALSSLCALSTLTITTRHSSAEHGTKICYDNGGKITSSVPAAREVGTTVTLENLFTSLPVRRKEFTKNLKKEFAKMCHLLYAYCLVSKGVKFTCTNQTKGSRAVVISTEGSSLVRENIISVFGTKQIQSVIEIDMIEPDEQILSDYKLHTISEEPLPFNFELIISSAVHGSGRSTSDRQFYYINDRPCEPHKITKLVNEVYKQFNSHQYPFVYLNVIMVKSFVDVNVTPDKRQIFLEKEKLLLATLKTSLLSGFKSCPSIYTEVSLLEKGTKRSIDSTECTTKKTLDVFRKSPKIKQESLIQPKLTESNVFKITVEETKSGDEERVFKKPKLVAEEKPDQSVVMEVVSAPKPAKLDEAEPKLTTDVVFLDKEPQVNDFKTVTLTKDESKADTSQRKYVTARASMSYIKELVESCRATKTQSDTKIRFRSQITPAANKTAEDELQKQITKDMFKKMEIIGQFNLGFIVTKLNNDLFIVDQHATDEKYNFEDLQLNTVIENQVLVNPSSMELSAANEELLIDNLDTFQKNGFKFLIDSTAPATKKVKLSAIPISKNYIFGKDDIEEMLFMMQEEVNVTACRPTRIRAMFASRACRKSVMIGCPLNQSDMRRLIDHMGEIDQPWNCPHGRPTIRHLVNLNLLESA